MPSTIPFTQATATDELVRELGVPQLVGSLRVWTADAHGDGIIFVRLSGRDVQGGETAMGQVTPLRDLVTRLDLATRLIVVSTNNSGARRYGTRPDFQLAEQAVLQERWCSWVAWRNADRIARDDLPLALFYDFLKRTRTALYLADLGRAVDWERDRLELGVRGLMSIEERVAIKQRTHGALERTWIARRRGWPGARPFGFRRHWATKFLEVDPQQWPFVKLIHCRYAQLEDGNGAGLRKLAAELAAAGCELSHNRIRRVLQDPVYVTGVYSVRYQGELIECRPIPLDDPIPLHLHQRNVELLGLVQARHSRTPLGYFCLNGVPIEHAACAQLRNAKGQQPLLKGRIHMNRGVFAYRHEPWVPACCVGYVIEQTVLENAVLPALLESAAESTLLHEAWSQLSAPPTTHMPGFLSPDERHRVVRELGMFERRKAQLAREFRARLVRGDETNELAYWELVAGISEEMGQLRRQLELADRFPDKPVPLLPTDESLRSALEETLLNVNEEPRSRVRRAALIRALVDRITISDRADGTLQVEVHTPLL